jgi:hypothetical protein
MEPAKIKRKTMSYPSEFDGWQTYPQSLDFPPLVVDTNASNDRLKQSASRLFVGQGEGSLGLLEFGPIVHPGRLLGQTFFFKLMSRRWYT